MPIKQLRFYNLACSSAEFRRLWVSKRSLHLNFYIEWVHMDPSPWLCIRDRHKLFDRCDKLSNATIFSRYKKCCSDCLSQSCRDIRNHRPKNKENKQTRHGEEKGDELLATLIIPVGSRLGRRKMYALQEWLMNLYTGRYFCVNRLVVGG